MPPHLERGARDAVAFVFSCPGEVEQDQGRPAAGKTGDNLAEVLSLMAHRSYVGTDLECEDWTRDNVWITNAWSDVEYVGLTGRTEATTSEVLSTENVSRLANELSVIEKVIVCSGTRAQEAVSALNDQGRLIRTATIVPLCHLGGLGINKWISTRELEEEGFATGKSRRIERLRRWSARLYLEITNNQSGRRTP